LPSKRKITTSHGDDVARYQKLNGYLLDISVQILCESAQGKGYKGYKGYKDGLQPESLADGNWLVKQN
jgi:hypothetical protein